MTERQWILREFDLFQDLDDEEMDAIGAAAPMATIPPGQVVHSPGRLAEVLFILKRGRMRLYRTSPDGRTLTVAFVEAGQVFGEMVALGQTLDDTYAETLEECVVCLMGRDDVERLMLSDPRVATRVAELLGSRVAELERRLADTVLRGAPERIAATLARLAQGQAPPTTVRLTHEQLADLVGTSRETTTKVLGDLAARGLVQLKRGRVVVRDPAGLGAAADAGIEVSTGGRTGRARA